MHPGPPVRPYPGAGGPAGHRGNGPFMGGLVLAGPMSAEAIEECSASNPRRPSPVSSRRPPCP